MKVLKKGKVPAGWHKRLMCTGFGRDTEEGCGAVLLVTEEDVFVGDVDPPRNRIIRYEAGRFCCPECGTITDLGKTDNDKCHPLGKKPTEKKLNTIRAKWNARHKKRSPLSKKHPDHMLRG